MAVEALAATLQQPQAFVASNLGFAGIQHLADLFQILGSIAGTARQHDFPGVFAAALAHADTAGRARRGRFSFQRPVCRRVRWICEGDVVWLPTYRSAWDPHRDASTR